MPALTLAVGAAAIACGGCGGAEDAPPRPQGVRCVEVFYEVTVRDVPAGARRVVAWAPIPPTDDHQTLDYLHLQSPMPHETMSEPQYGNRFLVVDLSDQDRSAGAVGFTVVFCVTRRAYRVLGRETVPSTPLAPEEQARYLASDRLVPVTGKVADEARRVACKASGPVGTARCIYDHLIETMIYAKTGAGWGRGDALYACDVRSGNCSDFHSLFVGEARSLGLAARFDMGLPLPEDKSAGAIPGYHCWAEFYLPEKMAWVPVDVSEAHRRPEKREEFFGGLDEHRVAFSRGRDISLPGAAAEPVNFAIYAHVEIDGKPHPAVQTTFRFADRNMPAPASGPALARPGLPNAGSHGLPATRDTWEEDHAKHVRRPAARQRHGFRFTRRERA